MRKEIVVSSRSKNSEAEERGVKKSGKLETAAAREKFFCMPGQESICSPVAGGSFKGNHWVCYEKRDAMALGESRTYAQQGRKKLQRRWGRDEFADRRRSWEGV